MARPSASSGTVAVHSSSYGRVLFDGRGFALYTLVLFESEEKARAREQDERRQGGLEAARATMAEIFDGPPEFVDLTVVNDMVPG